MFYWSKLNVLPIRKITGFVLLLIFKEKEEDGRVKFRRRSVMCHLPVTVTQLHRFLQTWHRTDRKGEGGPSVMFSQFLSYREGTIVQTEVTPPGSYSWLVPSSTTSKSQSTGCNKRPLSTKLSVLTFLSPGVVSASSWTQIIWMLFGLWDFTWIYSFSFF